MNHPTGPAIRLSQNVSDLRTSPTIAIQDHAIRLRAQGRRVWKMGLGQSPFPVPAPMVAALREHAPQKDYLPTGGLPALRAAVAEYHNRKPNVSVSADDVIVGPGSKELLFLTQLALDSQVLIDTPAWVSYAPQAQILGRRIRYIHTARSDHWRLRPEELDRACREHDGPFLLVLNDPSNPTGCSHGPERLREIAAVAREHGVLILSDEIYNELRFDGAPHSIASEWPEGVIIATGISKWCGAGGWRLGVFTFPPGLRKLANAIEAAASETFTTTSAPIQYAAVEAFAGNRFSDAMTGYLRHSRGVLEKLATACSDRLLAAGAAVERPDGAFYLFPDLEVARERLAARQITTSAQMCDAILQETGVMVLPGVVFGRAATELTLRMSLVDFDGAEALAQHAADPSKLPTACANVVEAVERLCAWIAEPKAL